MLLKIIGKIKKELRWDTRTRFILQLKTKASLLDIGCGAGEALKVFLQCRNDLQITGLDIQDFSKQVPEQVRFFRLNANSGKLPFDDNSFDAVTVIHLVEHIENVENLLNEIIRILKSGGRFYIETPDVKTVDYPKFDFLFKDKSGGPLNFYDDATHFKPVSRELMHDIMVKTNAIEIAKGHYRNLLYCSISPLLMILGVIIRKRRWFVVGFQHLTGWSVYCTGKKQPNDKDTK